MTEQEGVRSDGSTSSNSEGIAGKVNLTPHERKASSSRGSEEAGQGFEKKRKKSAPDGTEDDGADPQASDTDLRRQRRRITNRESAKRMRLKRQEELQAFHEQMKRVTLENEQLRQLSGYLQRQHITMASDIQHWQDRFRQANADVEAIYQQLEQVVALSALNPAVLEELGLPSSQAKDMVARALLQALPGAHLDKALDSLCVQPGPLAAHKPSPVPSSMAPGVSPSLAQANSASMAAMRPAAFQSLPRCGTKVPQQPSNPQAGPFASQPQVDGGSLPARGAQQPKQPERRMDAAEAIAAVLGKRAAGTWASSGDTSAGEPPSSSGRRSGLSVESQAAAMALAMALNATGPPPSSAQLPAQDAATGNSAAARPDRGQAGVCMRADALMHGAQGLAAKPSSRNAAIPSIAELMERVRRHATEGLRAPDADLPRNA